jgi:hypothetical protein
MCVLTTVKRLGSERPLNSGLEKQQFGSFTASQFPRFIVTSHCLTPLSSFWQAQVLPQIKIRKEHLAKTSNQRKQKLLTPQNLAA